MEKWEIAFRISLGVFLYAWNLLEGSRFHTPYPMEWVLLYPYPYWRLFLLILLIVLCRWSPNLGLLAALTLFFYLGDMFHLTQPWIMERNLPPPE